MAAGPREKYGRADAVGKALGCLGQRNSIIERMNKEKLLAVDGRRFIDRIVQFAVLQATPVFFPRSVRSAKRITCQPVKPLEWLGRSGLAKITDWRESDRLFYLGMTRGKDDSWPTKRSAEEENVFDGDTSFQFVEKSELLAIDQLMNDVQNILMRRASEEFSGTLPGSPIARQDSEIPFLRQETQDFGLEGSGGCAHTQDSHSPCLTPREDNLGHDFVAKPSDKWPLGS